MKLITKLDIKKGRFIAWLKSQVKCRKSLPFYLWMTGYALYLVSRSAINAYYGVPDGTSANTWIIMTSSWILLFLLVDYFATKRVGDYKKLSDELITELRRASKAINDQNTVIIKLAQRLQKYEPNSVQIEKQSIPIA